MRLLSSLLVALLIVPAYAQINCDVNGDGIGGSIADLILLIGLLQQLPPEEFRTCNIACNIDEDSDSMTIADMTSFIFSLRNPFEDPPQLSYHPDSDTMSIGSAQASPGQQLSLPIFLTSIDSLIAYELLVKIDPEYLSIVSINPAEDLELQYSFSPELLHIYDIASVLHIDSVFIFPGNYHLGDLVLNVNPDINQPVTTYVTFRTCPEDNFYTGMANMTFFVPVLVDGEITITPTGIDDQNSVLPEALSIEAYPNPFNGSVNLLIQSDMADRLIIYDILGREIIGFEIAAGSNKISWSAVDSNDKPVNSGVYFARLGENQSTYSKKLIYIK